MIVITLTGAVLSITYTNFSILQLIGVTTLDQWMHAAFQMRVTCAVKGAHCNVITVMLCKTGAAEISMDELQKLWAGT